MEVTITDRATRKKLGIPLECKYFCFCYPLESMHGQYDKLITEEGASVGWLFFLLLGGYGYFDFSGKLVRTNAFLLQSTKAVVQLEGPHRVAPAALSSLKSGERMRTVSIEGLKAIGYERFGWVNPGERPGGVPLVVDGIDLPGGGAFVYELGDGSAVCYDLVAKSKHKVPAASPPQAAFGDATDAAGDLQQHAKMMELMGSMMMSDEVEIDGAVLGGAAANDAHAVNDASSPQTMRSPPAERSPGGGAEGSKSRAAALASRRLVRALSRVGLPISPSKSTGSASSPSSPAQQPAASRPELVRLDSEELDDDDRYTKSKSVWEAIKTGHVRLLRGSYIVALWKKGGRLVRRQELPEEAFIDLEELQTIYGAGNKDRLLPIISISYCWLHWAQPDPDGFHLRTVALTLEKEMPKYQKGVWGFKGFPEVGVFWDFGSLYQKDPALWTPACAGPSLANDAAATEREAYENSRIPEHKASFNWALKNSMDLWYAHQGTCVYLLTALPPAEQLPAGFDRKSYEESGWPTYERCGAELIKRFYLKHAKFRQVLVLSENSGEQTQRSLAAQRRWPVGPEDFDDLVEKMYFTNGSDKKEVKEQFRDMSKKQLSAIKELDYSESRLNGFHMPPPTVEDARRLGGCLQLCKGLEKLLLTGCGFAAAKLEEMLLRLGATDGTSNLPKLEVLSLIRNDIRDAGVHAILKAFDRGAMPKLRVLKLAENAISRAGIKALLEYAVAHPTKHILQELDLTKNDPDVNADTPLKEQLKRTLSRNLSALHRKSGTLQQAGAHSSTAEIYW